MKNKNIIFIHSMFRAGSTYIFNKFRTYDEFSTYYEPLHHDLIKLRKKNLDIWKYDKKATDVMNHPELKKPHFYEFSNLFFDNEEKLPYFNTNFAYKEFFDVKNETGLKKYIDNIIEKTPFNQMPAFQFNRTSCRIKWFKEVYSSGINIFLLRNPRDQFESYYKRNSIGKNIFLAINLYILLTKEELSKELLEKECIYKLSDDIYKDLKNCMDLTKNYTLENHYTIFYYIWISSFIEAINYADCIIDMDKMNRDQNYINEIKKFIHDYTNVNIDFNDYKMKNNEFLSLSTKKIYFIENEINEKFFKNSLNSELIKEYVKTYNLEDDNKNFVHKLLRKFNELFK